MLKYRINNIFIFILCILRIFFFKRPTRNINNPKKILIIQLAKLGDMICTTPMFRNIKRVYPNSKIYVVGNSINYEVLKGNNDVDKYLTFSNRGFFDTLKKIKKEKIDFGCVTSPDITGLSLLILSGASLVVAPKIINGKSIQTKTYKILSRYVINKPHYMKRYAPREYLRLLEPIGIFANDTKKYLSHSDFSEKRINKFYRDNGINLDKDLVIGISPSAGNKIKEWSPGKFAKLADFIYREYSVKIIIVGGKSDKNEVDGMIKCLDKDTKVINSFNMFNIDELKALISKMNMFISVDTGPIYIAESYNIPTIDIVGPVDDKEQPPIGEFNKIVKVKRSKPELFVMNAREYDEKEAARQINEITVDMVVDKFKELIKKI